MKKRILVLETHHLGDAVLSVPFVRGARKNCEVLVVCRSSQRVIYEQLTDPGVEIQTWDPPWMAEEADGKKDSIADFHKMVRPWKPDVAVSCWADLRVHWLMKESGAKQRAGFPMIEKNLHAMHLPWRRKRLRWPALADRLASPLLLTDLLTRSPAHPAQLHLWRQISDRLALPFLDHTPWLTPGPLPSELRTWIDRARETGRPIWLLHGGARAPMRRWPAEHFLEIARRLQGERNAAILMTEVEPCGDALPWRTDSIAEFLGGLAAVDAVLCNDSFPAHAAAAMGTPVWTIFSAQDPSRFAPFGNEDRAISAAICPFRPCLDRCLRPSYECLEAVTVELVWGQITESWKR